MYGIKDPVIRERTWLEGREVSAESFWISLRFAEALRARVYQWDGQDRDGNPLAIVWWAGRRSGTLFATYEFTERGEQS